MYDTILVPVDGSATSRRALHHALVLAADAGATLHVLAVAEPAANPLAFGVDDVVEIEAAVGDLVEALREEGAARGVTVKTDVRRGQPAEMILAYAAEIDADLVVVGRQGASADPDAAFGRVAERVARKSSAPVVLVPAAE